MFSCQQHTMRAVWTFWGSGPALLTCCLAASEAQAGDMAAAEALFKEGRQLFDEGQIAQACDKFTASQRLDPSPGTLLNLARCHERQGKTASAWAEYLAAKRTAEAAGRFEVAAAARERALALEPSLASLTLGVAVRVGGLEVTRSGVKVEPATFGTKLPVDPGTHRIVATAPGYRSWSADVTVGEKQAQQIEIPALEPEANPSQVAPAPPPVLAPTSPLGATEPPRPEPEPGPPTLAYVIGGFGVAALGTGLVFGAVAKNRYDAALELCPSRTGCTSEEMSLRDDAETFANVSNVVVPVGAAALAVGVVLFLLHPGRSPERPGVGALWLPGRAFGVVEGRF